MPQPGSPDFLNPDFKPDQNRSPLPPVPEGNSPRATDTEVSQANTPDRAAISFQRLCNDTSSITIISADGRRSAGSPASLSSGSPRAGTPPADASPTLLLLRKLCTPPNASPIQPPLGTGSLDDLSIRDDSPHQQRRGALACTPPELKPTRSSATLMATPPAGATADASSSPVAPDGTTPDANSSFAPPC